MEQCLVTSLLCNTASINPSWKEDLFKVWTLKYLKVLRSLQSLNAWKKVLKEKAQKIQIVKTITVKEGNMNSLSPKHISTPKAEYLHCDKCDYSYKKEIRLLYL